MLEVMSLEVPAESVGTVTGAQSWRQRVPDFRRCDREELEKYKKSLILERCNREAAATA